MGSPVKFIADAWLNTLDGIGVFDLANMLRSRLFGEGEDIPPPQSQTTPYTPPFTGGQCTFRYRIAFTTTNSVNGATNVVQQFDGVSQLGAITGFNPVPQLQRPDLWEVEITSSTAPPVRYGVTGVAGIRDFGGGNISTLSITNIQFFPFSSLDVDSCGNLPNPNPSVPPSTGGGDLPVIPDNPTAVTPAIIVPSYNPFLAALAAAAAAAAAAGNALDGIRAIGEALGKLKDLLEEFLDRETEKEKRDRNKRRISVGAWRDMPIDGGFGTGKFTAQDVEYSPYQLQIEVQSFPSTVSRRLGINSPSYAHLEPIGWVFLRGASGGYSEPVPIRFLRSSIYLNDDTSGISFSFRENPTVIAQCRVWYSSPPSIS